MQIKQALREKQFKLASIITILIAISIILIQCKSSEKPEEPSTKIVTSADSGKTVAIHATDTIASHIPLTLTVNNLVSPTAPVVIGVYKSQHHFLNKKHQHKGYKFTPRENTLTAQIADLSYGEYAIGIYQDINNNGKFDKTLIGIPKEGYAFSNNFKPKVKAPSYDDCKFKYDSITNTVTMNLIK